MYIILNIDMYMNIITGVSAQWPTPKFWSRLLIADCLSSPEQLLFVPEETWVVLAACQLEVCKNKGAAAQPT